MSSIRELLKVADPLRNEPMPTDARRDLSRQAMVTEAFADRPETARTRRSVARLVMVTILAIAVLFLGSQLPSFIGTQSYAAVRFEIRLAEDSPAPGLREMKLPGESRSIYVHDEVILSNGDIDQAQLIATENPLQFSVGVDFNLTGAQKIRVATENHIGRPVAILIDGEVVIAPVVRAAIGSSAVISGNYTREQALAIVNGI